MCFIMDVITSDKNTLREFAKFREKKHRDAEGKYLIEGYRNVKDSIEHLIKPKLLMSNTAYERFGAAFAGCSITVCNDFAFSKACDTVSSQGILCIAEKPVYQPDYAADKVLVLDKVRDPGNMGTIIRTALATGFKDIYCIDCVDFYNPKVVRSAMSAASRVRLFDAEQSIFLTLKSHDYTVICADMHGESVFELFEPIKRACLVIGNEANGVGDETFAIADRTISLPMEAGESLNAGVSAAVLMYMITYGTKNLIR